MVCVFCIAVYFFSKLIHQNKFNNKYLVAIGSKQKEAGLI